MQNTLVILALIQALTKEVNLLETQLAQLQAAQSAVAARLNAAIQTPTPTVTPMANETTGAAEAPTSTTISVSFNATDTDEGFVTVKNTSDVAVRVQNLDVDGTLVGITDGPVYGDGYVYAPTVKDIAGAEYQVLACTGVGSEGIISLSGGATVDPCVRRDANLAKNELQPGETMVLRYTGSPTKVTYQSGSIVEVATGNDVSF